MQCKPRSCKNLRQFGLFLLSAVLFSSCTEGAKPESPESEEKYDLVESVFLLPDNLDETVAVYEGTCNEDHTKIAELSASRVDVVRSKKSWTMDDAGLKVFSYSGYRDQPGCLGYAPDERNLFIYIQFVGNDRAERKGWVRQRFLYRDKYKNNFFEDPEINTVSKIRNHDNHQSLFTSVDPSDDFIDTCDLHEAASEVLLDLKKNEFESTVEYEARLANKSSPYFENITYMFVYKNSETDASYDADTEEFQVNTLPFPFLKDHYFDPESVGGQKYTFEPSILIESRCAGPEPKDVMIYYYRDVDRYPSTIIQFTPGNFPADYFPAFSSQRAAIGRKEAPLIEESFETVFGVTPTGLPETRVAPIWSSAPTDHFTIFEGDLSYIALRNSISGEIYSAHVSESYKKLLIEDFRSQLAYLGYEVGNLDGDFSESSLAAAVERVVVDGLIPDANVSIDNLIRLAILSRRDQL